jgi:hypothetical protein
MVTLTILPLLPTQIPCNALHINAPPLITGQALLEWESLCPHNVSLPPVSLTYRDPCMQWPNRNKIPNVMVREERLVGEGNLVLFLNAGDGSLPLTRTCWACPRSPVAQCVWRDSRIVIFGVDGTTKATSTFNIAGGMGYMLTYTFADFGSSPGVWATELQVPGGPVLLDQRDKRRSPFQPTTNTFYVMHLHFIARQVRA